MKSSTFYFLIALLPWNLHAQCFPESHSTNWFDSWISCTLKENPNPAHGASHWILFDLNRDYQIDQFKIWNLNDPERLNWGMEEIAIDYSTDSVVWNHAGSFTLEISSGNNRYEGMPWTSVTIPKARYVLITDVSASSGSCAGLSEILFSAEKVQTTVVTEEEQSQEGFSLQARPNPFNDVLQVDFTNATRSSIHYQLVDPYGKIMDAGTIQTNQGYGYLKWFARKWQTGAYYLTAHDGFTQQRIMLIKI